LFYNIRVKSSTNVFIVDEIYCNQVEVLSCSFPMSALNSVDGKYKLPLNSLIRAQVAATNGQGESEFSAVNTVGVLIQTIPSAPVLKPIRIEAQSTTSAIAIEMPEIVSLSELAGGSEITSYNLESNQGAGSVFYEVTGESIEQLNRVIIVTTTPGQTYKFRYRVKNMLGFSTAYSTEAEFKSAKAP